MFTDCLGNPFSTDRAHLISGSDNLIHGIDDFVEGLLSYHPRLLSIVETAEHNSQCSLAQIYAAWLMMFGETQAAPDQAKPYLSKAVEASKTAHAREHDLIKLTTAWVEDDIDQALTICEQILCEYPHDLATLKLGQYMLFNRGDSQNMLRLAKLCYPANQTNAHIHAMMAFGYEQCHQLDEAERSAQDGLTIDPGEAWCHHALAHVFLTQDRIEDGVIFLERVAPDWEELNSFIYTHNYWHLGLFYIEQRRLKDALMLYDRHLWGRDKTYSQDQIGAVSFLARLEFAGCDVGERWLDLAHYIAARGAEIVQPFLTLHYIYGLARAGRLELSDLMTAVSLKADQDRQPNQPWKRIVYPTSKAIIAYHQGAFKDCADRLEGLRPLLSQIGGSHAQRDLFEQFYKQAKLRC